MDRKKHLLHSRRYILEGFDCFCFKLVLKKTSANEMLSFVPPYVTSGGRGSYKTGIAVGKYFLYSLFFIKKYFCVCNVHNRTVAYVYIIKSVYVGRVCLLGKKLLMGKMKNVGDHYSKIENYYFPAIKL